MEYEQISFLETIEETIEKNTRKSVTYDAGICYKCLCNQCIYSVAIYPYPTKEELEILKSEESCWNCEECYYYGMDNEKLSKDIVKFECGRFKKSNHYIELEIRKIEREAERRRKTFKII